MGIVNKYTSVDCTPGIKLHKSKSAAPVERQKKGFIQRCPEA